AEPQGDLLLDRVTDQGPVLRERRLEERRVGLQRRDPPLHQLRADPGQPRIEAEALEDGSSLARRLRHRLALAGPQDPEGVPLEPDELLLDRRLQTVPIGLAGQPFGRRVESGRDRLAVLPLEHLELPLALSPCPLVGVEQPRSDHRLAGDNVTPAAVDDPGDRSGGHHLRLLCWRLRIPIHLSTMDWRASARLCDISAGGIRCSPRTRPLGCCTTSTPRFQSVTTSTVTVTRPGCGTRGWAGELPPYSGIVMP